MNPLISMRFARPVRTKNVEIFGRHVPIPLRVFAAALTVAMAVAMGAAPACSSDNGGPEGRSGSSVRSERSPSTTLGGDGSPDGSASSPNGSSDGSSEGAISGSGPDRWRAADLVRAVCEAEATVSDLGTVSAPQVDEASGLAASRSQPGIWWTHNDSGGDPELFAVDESGRLVAVLAVEGAKAIDWEDMAIAVDADGVENLYIADIGDNRRGRDYVSIYRVPAPRLTLGAETEHLSAKATRFDFSYPDGSRDAEALLVDPADDSFYIIDKNWSLTGVSGLYRGTFERPRPAGPASMEKLSELEYPPATLITAADLSPDGTAVAVRAYGIEYLYSRKAGQSVAEALEGRRCTGPRVSEIQGEAIAFSADNRSYATIAEGSNPTMHLISTEADASGTGSPGADSGDNNRR